MSNNLDLLKITTWPFQEAQKLYQRYSKMPEKKDTVLLETGYGPSGLPHIGTFGEVFRTTLVANAFTLMYGIKTKIIVFSDDMDGMRKVPDNVPNQELLSKYLEYPLTSVPDPFNEYNSFGEYNNNMLKRFLDSFNFEYEFISSTNYYKSGNFNSTLIKVAENYQAILDIMLPSLGEERKQTYSPFLPICPTSNNVLQVAVSEVDPKNATITYVNHNGEEVTQSFLDGNAKLQWKVDFAMRWATLGIDYEMCGKDLIDSVNLASKICRILNVQPPQNLIYELFLDNEGKKISKSKGNGLSIDEWLHYAPASSISLFMYLKPKTAKRLYFDIIPKLVDDIMVHLHKYPKLSQEEKYKSPIYYIYGDSPPVINDTNISYSLILNLVSVAGINNVDELRAFILKYKQVDDTTLIFINELLSKAINYYNDFVKSTLTFKVPNDLERSLIQELYDVIEAKVDDNTTAEELQSIIYGVVRDREDIAMKEWFKLLYQVLLGQDIGPRLGSLFTIYGKNNTLDLLQKSLEKK